MKHHLESEELAVETSHIWREALCCYDGMAQFALKKQLNDEDAWPSLLNLVQSTSGMEMGS